MEELTGYATRDWKKGGKPPFDPVFMLFEAFHQILENQGLIAREGSIIDASFVDAPRQRNTREENQHIKKGERPAKFDENTSVGRQKDSQARWIKKNQEIHYGWKNHAKVDAKSKLIIKSETTPANVHDSRFFKSLLDEKDQAVLADSAYHSEEHEAFLLKIDSQAFLMRKATRNHALPAEEVEHVFARMSQMSAQVCRSIGLKRATSQNHLSNLVYNMDRYAFLAK